MGNGKDRLENVTILEEITACTNIHSVDEDHKIALDVEKAAKDEIPYTNTAQGPK